MPLRNATSRFSVCPQYYLKLFSYDLQPTNPKLQIVRAQALFFEEHRGLQREGSSGFLEVIRDQHRSITTSTSLFPIPLSLPTYLFLPSLSFFPLSCPSPTPCYSLFSIPYSTPHPLLPSDSEINNYNESTNYEVSPAMVRGSCGRRSDGE